MIHIKSLILLILLCSCDPASIKYSQISIKENELFANYADFIDKTMQFFKSKKFEMQIDGESFFVAKRKVDERILEIWISKKDEEIEYQWSQWGSFNFSKNATIIINDFEKLILEK